MSEEESISKKDKPDIDAALEGLKQALQSPDENVRRAAARALITEMEPGLAEVLKMINFGQSQV